MSIGKPAHKIHQWTIYFYRWGFGWVDKAQCLQSPKQIGAVLFEPRLFQGFSMTFGFYYPGQKNPDRREVHEAQVHRSIIGYRAISTSMRRKFATPGYSGSRRYSTVVDIAQYPMIKQYTCASCISRLSQFFWPCRAVGSCLEVFFPCPCRTQANPSHYVRPA